MQKVRIPIIVVKYCEGFFSRISKLQILCPNMTAQIFSFPDWHFLFSKFGIANPVGCCQSILWRCKSCLQASVLKFCSFRDMALLLVVSKKFFLIDNLISRFFLQILTIQTL